MPDIAWIKQNSSFNTAEIDDLPSIAVHSDRVYVVYETRGTVQGQSKTSGEGNYDIVVMAMNKGNGTVRWIKQSADFNASTSNVTPSIAADSTGIYVTYAIRRGTIPGGSNPDNKTGIVVMKMNADGDRQWIKQYNLSTDMNAGEHYPKVAVNSVGVYVTYTTDFAGANLLEFRDIAVMGMNKNNGNVLWTKQDNTLNTPSDEIDSSIAADSDGIYVTYQTAGAVVGTNTDPSDLVVTRMNTAGVIQWRKQSNTFNNTDSDLTSNFITATIAADSDGLYITYNTTGNVIGETIENENGADVVVMRMKKADGNVEWTKQNLDFNTTTIDGFPNIAADSTGLYLVYTTAGSVPGGASSGILDMVVMRMNKLDGEVEWIRQNSTFNTIEDELAIGIVADSDGLYISYVTDGTVPDGTRADSNTLTDVVVMKMNKPPPVCLLEGTLVRTPTGSVPIELVKKDDYVLNQHYMPVRVVRTRQSTFEYKENPTTTYDLANVVYTLPAGTVGATSNVYLTKSHKFMTRDGTMKRPEEYGLERSKLSEICKTKDLYTVYHLRLEDEYNNHFIVNGDCIVEDWYDWPRPKGL
jgi:hypothetical protein